MYVQGEQASIYIYIYIYIYEIVSIKNSKGFRNVWKSVEQVVASSTLTNCISLRIRSTEVPPLVIFAFWTFLNSKSR